MRNLKRWALFLTVALLVGVCALINLRPVSSQNLRKGTKRFVAPRFENFDIRAKATSSDDAATSKSERSSQLVLERPKLRSSSAKTRVIQNGMHAGETQLAERIPQLKVVYNEIVGVPELVSAEGGTALAAKSGADGDNEGTLRNFLAEN
ncbi:MAG TPA: hypothetical protein VJS64_06825, partial [Pyrinomonadaceae bacterium]|nr:hypothetical protein [Pyrinomonadaceae bacterium]